MAVVGQSGPSPWLLPSTSTLPERPLAGGLRRWCYPVRPSLICSTRLSIVSREPRRCGRQGFHPLRLPRASSGGSGEGGDGEEEGRDSSEGNGEDEGDAIEPEEEGGANRGGEDEQGGGWRSFWGRRKRRDPVERAEESDSARNERIEEEEVSRSTSGEGSGGWRFPWNWNSNREQNEEEAREEEADRERRRRDGIFVLDIENESLELRWQDLLDPTLENILALILTGFFVLAIVQILWQLFVVAAAITVSAVKYTVLAIFLIGILVFLV